MGIEPESRERRITIPKETWEALTYYSNDEKMKVSEAIRNTITPEAIVVQILNDHLKKAGHYPVKGKGQE